MRGLIVWPESRALLPVLERTEGDVLGNIFRR